MGSIVAGRSRLRTLAALAIVAAVAAACSGGDEAAPTTTRPATTLATTPTPTTTVAPTTQTPTTQPPTTQPQTTAPPTTPPPTTAPSSTVVTVDPAAAEPVVAQLMIDYITAVNELFRDPANESRRSALAAVAAQDAFDQIIASADRYVRDRSRASVDESDPSRVEPRPITFVLAPNGDPVVGMDGCVIDTDRQVAIAEDGTETTTDSTPDSFVMHFDFTAVEGRWLVTSIAIDQRYDGQVGCE